MRLRSLAWLSLASTAITVACATGREETEQRPSAGSLAELRAQAQAKVSASALHMVRGGQTLRAQSPACADALVLHEDSGFAELVPPATKTRARHVRAAELRGSAAPPTLPSVNVRAERFGREGALVGMAGGLRDGFRPGGPRVASRQADAMVESWENRQEGYEHTFRIAQRPAGDGPLRVELRVQGALVRVDADGAGATLTPMSGPELRYDQLKVIGAKGETVPARMEASPEGLALVVDDAMATYPLLVDPLLTTGTPSGSWEGSFEGAGSEFGWSVATAGDVNGDGYDDFLVGTNGSWSAKDTPGYVGHPRVLLYLGGPTAQRHAAWSVGDISADTSRLPSFTGYGVGDVNGDTFDDIAVNRCTRSDCAVEIYLGSGNGLATTPVRRYLINEAQRGDDGVAAGDVNGDGFDDVLVLSTTKAQLFLGGLSGPTDVATWTYNFAASTGDVAPQAAAVDVNGDGKVDLVLGQPGNAPAGAALVFLNSGSAWPGVASTTLTPPVGVTGFGDAVGAAGDINKDGKGDVLIGARSGRIALHLGQASGLPETPAAILTGAGGLGIGRPSGNERRAPTVTGAGDVNGDGFDDVIVGAQFEANALGGTGRVRVFTGSATGINFQAPALTVEIGPSPSASSIGNTNHAFLGHSVGAAGDFDGDGFADILYSADGWTESPRTRFDGHGRVFLNKIVAPLAKAGDPAVCAGTTNRCPAGLDCVSASGTTRCTTLCKGNLGSGVPKACTNSRAPFCGTVGADTGICLPCDGNFGGGTPRACVSSASPLCAKTGPDSGACLSCDGDFGSGSTLPCPTVALGICYKVGPGQAQCQAGCRVDSNCKATEFCGPEAAKAPSCKTKLSNGEPLPNATPELSKCVDGVAARVCQSGVCDPKDDRCGLASGTACTSDAQCRGVSCTQGTCATPVAPPGADAGTGAPPGSDAGSAALADGGAAPTPSAGDEGGCSCDQAGRPSGPGASIGIGAFLAMALVVRRRRQSGPRA